ncbi:MAG: MarR family winged helix-turn-helix transcriptional regulator [Candidatus Dormibacteria bacterium]
MPTIPTADARDPKAAAAPTATPLHASLGFRFGRSQRKLRATWAARIADLELAPPQAAVLRALAERPGLGVRAAARDIGTDPMNVKHVVDALEARGLVTSSLDPSDRRTRCLRLTRAGSDLTAKVESRAQLHEEWLMGVLGRARYGRLEQALESLEVVLGLTGTQEGRDGD